MNVQLIREALENRQIFIYFGAVAAAVAAAYAVPGTTALEIVVNPALALRAAPALWRANRAWNSPMISCCRYNWYHRT